MRADNSHQIIAAAVNARSRRSNELLLPCAAWALRDVPSVLTLSPREAGVSRSWLYTQTHLRAKIEQLRQRQRSSPGRIAPDRQRASDPISQGQAQCRPRAHP
jgi:hypothetical protein